MKFHDRSRTRRPDSSFLFPLAVLFISSLNGLSLHEAWQTSLAAFFTHASGLILWAQVILLNLVLMLFFSPIFRVHIQCIKACEPSEELVNLAYKRLNRLKLSTIAISIAFFLAGRLALFVAGESYGLAELPLHLVEAAVNGFFTGVALALQFDHRFYEARETLRKVGGKGNMRYSSLFSKIILIVLSLTLFMALQALSFGGSFYSLAGRNPQGHLPPEPGILSGPEIFMRAGQVAGLKSALEVFLLKMVLVFALVAQMIFQIKLIIVRPLATILDRLKLLNSPDPGSGKAIDIVQNDEFASLFAEINTLILKQRGQLEFTRKRLEDIVAGAADPIIAFDDELKLRLFNPAAEAAFGCSRDQAIGGGLERFLGPGAGAFIESHGSGLARLEWKKADGTTSLMESHISRAGSGDEAWTIAILRDISRQAEFEENLRRARTEAENASRMKSEFLANMSHELRTPLNAILGFTQLLDDDQNLTGPQKERIRVIMRSGEHLLSLINDILDISKIEAGKMELHPSVFDLWEFQDELRDLFELRCRKKNLSLYFDKGESLPRYVRGDLGKLRQIMLNLLGNAVKFTDEGGVSVFAEADGANVRFAVRDTGRGIPKDEQESVLKPFVQASTTDHEGGTGLGLAISSRYVAMMGGTFSIQSTPGEGSVFSFSVPLEAQAEAPARPETEDSDIRLVAGTEVTALVVDDQVTNRLVLKEMLERVGFSVVEAEDGRAAVERAIDLRPAIVFMDIKMPVMDGYEAVIQLKKDPRTSGAIVFALTASAFINDEERIASSGFDGFLAKPFKQGSLYRLIREKGGLALETSPAPRAAEGPRGPPDFGEAAALDERFLTRISEAALINDFASLASLSREMASASPSLASALDEAASTYDEAAIASFLERVRAAREGAKHGH